MAPPGDGKGKKLSPFPPDSPQKGDSPHSRQPSEPTSTQSPGSSKIFEKQKLLGGPGGLRVQPGSHPDKQCHFAQSRQPGSSVRGHRERQGCEVPVRRLVSWQARKKYQGLGFKFWLSPGPRPLGRGPKGPASPAWLGTSVQSC